MDRVANHPFEPDPTPKEHFHTLRIELCWNGPGRLGWRSSLSPKSRLVATTLGLVPAFRGRGIYSAFLKQLIAYLKAIGYERLTTSHDPNNRAALIADLKVGFDIVGLELHESHGPLVKTAYHLHEDRRQAFERVFSTTRESINEADPRASAA